MLDPARWVLPELLAAQAVRHPDRVWLTVTDGESLTFGTAADEVRRVAGYFASLGVGPGDRVAVLLPNGADYLRVWLGLGTLGAVTVLLNTELRGAFLRHQLTSSRVELAVVDSGLLPVVLAIRDEVPALRRVVVTGAGAPATGSLEAIDWNRWRAAAGWTGAGPRARDIFSIMYTSGTSGPAKGVLMPHAHCALYGIGAVEALGLVPEDRYYIVLPLFHANGLLMQLAATLVAGIPAVIRPRFSASGWLDDIRKYQATVTNTLGALAAFLVAQPPSPRDRDHRLRAMLNGPNLPEHEAVFRDRFGVQEVMSGFGMTEVNIPIWGRPGIVGRGTGGFVHDRHFEVIVADPETDRPLGPGELGEILVRPKVPFGFMAGYDGLPQETVEAWRNLWFHTGDAGMVAPDGFISFIDRLKDRIRRRGENISAAEVEQALGQYPDVAEVAVFAVPSDFAGGEDELMIALVSSGGDRLDLDAVARFADEALPRFARPRYFEQLTDLPKTATGKVQRAVLRKRGVATAWDRDAGPAPTIPEPQRPASLR